MTIKFPILAIILIILISGCASQKQTQRAETSTQNQKTPSPSTSVNAPTVNQQTASGNKWCGDWPGDETGNWFGLGKIDNNILPSEVPVYSESVMIGSGRGGANSLAKLFESRLSWHCTDKDVVTVFEYLADKVREKGWEHVLPQYLDPQQYSQLKSLGAGFLYIVSQHTTEMASIDATRPISADKNAILKIIIFNVKGNKTVISANYQIFAKVS